jgi:hypothetical protein
MISSKNGMNILWENKKKILCLANIGSTIVFFSNIFISTATTLTLLSILLYANYLKNVNGKLGSCILSFFISLMISKIISDIISVSMSTFIGCFLI